MWVCGNAPGRRATPFDGTFGLVGGYRASAGRVALDESRKSIKAVVCPWPVTSNSPTSMSRSFRVVENRGPHLMAAFLATDNGNPPPMNVSDLVAKPFEWGSALRGRRFFHPVGALATGSLERLAAPDYGLPVPSTDVIARLSKAVGTPGALPDFIGLAIRIAPQPWDILLVSAGSGALSRAALLRPATAWTGQTMTNLMPFRYREQLWWLRARITSDVGGAGLSLDDIRRCVENGGVEVTLDQARGRGDFEQLGRMTLFTLMEETDVSFDPVLNVAPGLSLSPGWLADLRLSAYRRSREGREVKLAVPNRQ
jgi:hypothetical protein